MRTVVVKTHKRACGGKRTVVRAHKKVIGASKTGLAKNIAANFAEGLGGKTFGNVVGTALGGGGHAASLGKQVGSNLSGYAKGLAKLPIVRKAATGTVKSFGKNYPKLFGKAMQAKRYLKNLKTSGL